MQPFSRKASRVEDEIEEKDSPQSKSPADTPMRNQSTVDVPPIRAPNASAPPVPAGRVPAIAVIMGAIASIGGFMFGYESGQISGTHTSPHGRHRMCRHEILTRIQASWPCQTS